jgi:hypothetical protein
MGVAKWVGRWLAGRAGRQLGRGLKEVAALVGEESRGKVAGGNGALDFSKEIGDFF